MVIFEKLFHIKHGLQNDFKEKYYLIICRQIFVTGQILSGIAPTF
jgi:hypothetical protein